MSKSFAFLQFGCASIFLFLWICVGHSVKQDLDSTKYFKERFLKKRCNLDEMCCICITLCCICITLCYICNKWYVLLKPTFPKQRSLKYFLFQRSCTELLWTIQIHRKNRCAHPRCPSNNGVRLKFRNLDNIVYCLNSFKCGQLVQQQHSSKAETSLRVSLQVQPSIHLQSEYIFIVRLFN